MVFRSLLTVCLLCSSLHAEPWKRHVIDNSSRGADGVRLSGRDIVTGWEEGGVVRVYRYPGASKARSPWPAEMAGSVGSPEDALFVDLDADGKVDVLSASEGKTKALHIHWAAPAWALPYKREAFRSTLSAGSSGRRKSIGRPVRFA